MRQKRTAHALLISIINECQWIIKTWTESLMQILAFPCNSWNQESGSANEISSFARTQYGAKFPLFAKVDAIGENAHPVMRWLTNNLPGSGWTPKWNFSKWLVNQQGMPVKSYDSTFDFDRLSFDIEAELLKGTSQRQSQGLKRWLIDVRSATLYRPCLGTCCYTVIV